MKKAKRFLSMLLVLATLCSMLPTAAFAVEEVSAVVVHPDAEAQESEDEILVTAKYDGSTFPDGVALSVTEQEDKEAISDLVQAWMEENHPDDGQIVSELRLFDAFYTTEDGAAVPVPPESEIEYTFAFPENVLNADVAYSVFAVSEEGQLTALEQVKVDAEKNCVVFSAADAQRIAVVATDEFIMEEAAEEPAEVVSEESIVSEEALATELEEDTDSTPAENAFVQPEAIEPEAQPDEQEEETVSNQAETQVVAEVPKMASVTDSGSCGDNVTWTLDSGGTLTISGTGLMRDYDNNSWDAHHAPWYAEREQIKFVVIQQGITYIGSYAFYNCSNLTTVSIPSSITSVGYYTFCQCSSLTSVSIPNSVASIPRYTFNNCSSLTSVRIPNSVTSIESYAFSECTSLKNVTIPCSVTDIYVGAFSNCSRLTTVSIPDSVTSIESFAFGRCDNLTSIEVANDNRCYRSTGGVLFSKDQTELIAFPCGKLGSYAIPNSVTNIGDWAFSHCSLTSVSIPSSVIGIGSFAFGCCDNLTSIEVANDNRCYRSTGGVLFSKDQTELIAFPCGKSGSYTVPNGVTSIGEYAFSNCISLSRVSIPDSVTSIGIHAFECCGSLTSVSIPNSVTRIGTWAFEGCNSLTSVSIPNGVTGIARHTFTNCRSLTDVHFSGNAPTIDLLAFQHVTATAYYPADNTTWTADKLQNYGGTITWVAVGTPSVKDISTCTVTLSATSYSYDGTAKQPSVTVKNGSTTLTNGTDYSVDYSNNTNAGTATVTIAGKGNYTGTATKTFTIAQAAPVLKFANATVSKKTTDSAFTNTLTKTTGGTVTYSSSNTGVAAVNSSSGQVTIKGAGTATITASAAVGKNYKAGSASYTLTVSTPSINISTCTVTLNPTSYTYDGKAKQPAVTVKDGSTTLTNGTHYSVAYSDNTNAGTATVTITGKGNYNGKVTKNFTIFYTTPSLTKLENTYSGVQFTWGKVNGAAKYRVFRKSGSEGWSKVGDTTSTSYTDKTVKAGTKYTYTVRCLSSDGKTYTSDYNKTGKTITYIAAPVLSKVENVNGGVKVTWAKSTGASKYRVFRKTGSEGWSKVGDTTSTSYTDKTVKAGKKYTYTARCISSDGKTYTSGCDATGKSVTYSEVQSGGFTWGTDNWSFNNWPEYFGYKRYIDQIDSTYLNRLKNNLSNTEYYCIFIPSVFNGGYPWIDKLWNGSCYGMSSLAHLSKKGLLPYSTYKTGATKLSQLSYPLADKKVSSLITYYQMLQVKDVIQQQYRTVPTKSNKENIQKLISLLKNNDTVLIGFQKNGWGAHAILAYGYEYGSYSWNNVTYQGCIKICDPNASMGYNSQYNIYFNTKSYNWTIPAYLGVTSVRGARFNYIGANVNEINAGGYLSGTSAAKMTDFVARIDAAAISNNRSIVKVRESTGSYFTQNNSSDDIVEDYSYVLGGKSEGVIGYNLFDATSAYKVSQGSAEKLQLAIDYGNCYLEAKSAAGNYAIFDKKGYVELDGDSANYQLAMTFNEDYPTDWFTVQVSGAGGDNVSLLKTSEGYVVSGDNLKNVKVDANNRDKTVTGSFSTTEAEACICQKSNGALDVRIDKDHNGTYETSVINATQTTNLATPQISKLENVYGGVKLTWGKVAGAAKYRVFYKTGNGNWTKIGDTTATNYTWKVAKSGTKYAFTLRCVSSDGKTFTSSYNTTGKSITYIAAPTISKVENVNGGMKLTWGKVTGAAKYRIFYKTGKGGWTKLADTTSTTYTWKEAKNGTTYAFTVRCISKDGKAYTSGYNTAGKSLTYVATPTLSSAKNSKAKTMTASWKKLIGVTGFQIQYSTDKNFKSGNKAVTVKNASAASQAVSGLTKGKTYYVRIRSYKTVSGKNVYSAWSAAKSVKITK